MCVCVCVRARRIGLSKVTVYVLHSRLFGGASRRGVVALLGKGQTLLFTLFFGGKWKNDVWVVITGSDWLFV